MSITDSFDFTGWATKNDVKCSDGRTIRKDAFKHCDGKTVPLVWNHRHDDVNSVLGHAILENRDNGVYAYGKFNNTASAQNAKEMVKNGDISGLSIWANKLQQSDSGDVFHGEIRELSLCLATANPEAYIDSVVAHSGDMYDDEAIIFMKSDIKPYIEHSDEPEEDDKEEEPHVEHADNKVEEPNESKEDKNMAAEDRTVQDVIDGMTEEQKTVMYALIGQALEDAGVEGGEMKHNVFDDDYEYDDEDVISHSDIMEAIEDAPRYGSLKDSFLQHGITDIEYLFPEAKNLNTPPDFIKREMAWVSKVMNGVHHTPFSRIKSMFADITADEARAKGYTKGHKKVEEVFGLLKRSTTPTTIYKKQKLERDDVIDITDFDVVAWLKGEMRMMLDEEIARAVLVGDGRMISDDDKINEQNIRPIWTDDVLYTHKEIIALPAEHTDEDKARAFIRACIKSRKFYKGTGSPKLFTTEDVITDCLLIEDKTGRIIYDSVDKLATALRVSEIVTVPVMENLSRTDDELSRKVNLMGIIVNLSDYNIGADKGGAVNMFDDFDIDYNAQKYLIETRCSGALVKPKSAIAIELDSQAAAPVATSEDLGA